MRWQVRRRRPSEASRLVQPGVVVTAPGHGNAATPPAPLPPFPPLGRAVIPCKMSEWHPAAPARWGTLGLRPLHGGLQTPGPARRHSRRDNSSSQASQQKVPDSHRSGNANQPPEAPLPPQPMRCHRGNWHMPLRQDTDCLMHPPSHLGTGLDLVVVLLRSSPRSRIARLQR
jgi:hypothetical protein